MHNNILTNKLTQRTSDSIFKKNKSKVQNKKIKNITNSKSSKSFSLKKVKQILVTFNVTNKIKDK
jgi:hypothetical protein